MSLWEISVEFSRGSTCWARPPPKDSFYFSHCLYCSFSHRVPSPWPSPPPPFLFPLSIQIHFACFAFSPFSRIYCNIHFWLFSFPCFTLRRFRHSFLFFVSKQLQEEFQELLNTWAWFRVISGQSKRNFTRLFLSGRLGRVPRLVFSFFLFWGDNLLKDWP